MRSSYGQRSVYTIIALTVPRPVPGNRRQKRQRKHGMDRAHADAATTDLSVADATGPLCRGYM